MIRAAAAIAIMLCAAAASAQDAVLPSPRVLKPRIGINNPGAVDPGAANRVTKLPDTPKALPPIISLGKELVAPDAPLGLFAGLRAMPKSIGFINPLDGPIEFVVTAVSSGAVQRYTLGSLEVVTVQCTNDCRSEYEVSIETKGRPIYVSSFDGGTILVPISVSGRWELAALD